MLLGKTPIWAENLEMDFFLVTIIRLRFLLCLDHCGTECDLSTSPLLSELEWYHKLKLL